EHLEGVVRGLLAADRSVTDGLKIGDVDPRGDSAACFAVSDKSLAVGGGVLEAALAWIDRRGS
ncbi:MAG: molybdenum hydroxylase, partial [Acidimicrobiia bacterium]